MKLTIVAYLNYRTKCDDGKMGTSGEKSMICKVPQHIQRQTIDLPEKTAEENKQTQSEEKSEERESMISTDAEEIEFASSTIAPDIEETTDMLPEENNADVTASDKVAAARVMGLKDVVTEAPAGNTMWTRVTRWGWKLVLKTCNLHYIVLLVLRFDNFFIKSITLNLNDTKSFFHCRMD